MLEGWISNTFGGGPLAPTHIPPSSHRSYLVRCPCIHHSHGSRKNTFPLARADATLVLRRVPGEQYRHQQISTARQLPIFTYGHRPRIRAGPVRSPVLKPWIGWVVLRWETTRECHLLYVFACFSFCADGGGDALDASVGCGRPCSRYLRIEETGCGSLGAPSHGSNE